MDLRGSDSSTGQRHPGSINSELVVGAAQVDFRANFSRQQPAQVKIGQRVVVMLADERGEGLSRTELAADEEDGPTPPAA